MTATREIQDKRSYIPGVIVTFFFVFMVCPIASYNSHYYIAVTLLAGDPSKFSQTFPR